MENERLEAICVHIVKEEYLMNRIHDLEEEKEILCDEYDEEISELKKELGTVRGILDSLEEDGGCV